MRRVRKTDLKKPVGYLFLVFFVLILVSIVVLNSHAVVDIATSVYIENQAPTVESVYLSNTAFQRSDSYPGGVVNTLLPGTTKTVFLTGVAEDLNGAADITEITAVFYRSGVGEGSNCLSDKNDCYRVDPCLKTTNPNNDTQVFFSCSIAISYMADSTISGGRYPDENWQAYVKVIDGDDDEGENLSLTKEMTSLLSLYIPSQINYGVLSLGEHTLSTNNQDMTVIQFGNTTSDAEVFSEEDMACSIRGEIPLENQGWSLNDVDFTQGTALSSSPANTDLNVGFQDSDDTAVQKFLYWNIGVPESGIEGVCSGTVVIRARPR